MFAYLVRRVAAIVPTLIFVSMLIFGLQQLLPGDPAVVLAGEDRDPNVVAYLRQKMHLDEPLPVRYLYWIKGVLHGDLGESLRMQKPVRELILEKLPVTIELAAFTEANAHSKKNLEALVASATAAARGAETVGAQAMAYSKKAFDDQVSAARSLAGAKSLQEVVELQTSFARTFLEAYMAEMGKFTETVSASVKDSMKPLNERVTDVVERLQAAR